MKNMQTISSMAEMEDIRFPGEMVLEPIFPLRLRNEATIDHVLYLSKIVAPKWA